MFFRIFRFFRMFWDSLPENSLAEIARHSQGILTTRYNAKRQVSFVNKIVLYKNSFLLLSFQQGFRLIGTFKCFLCFRYPQYDFLQERFSWSSSPD